ncbi:uncharacterized protein BcabD6B2_14410 [Babesia caballi]|uniref:HTH OST-type domain-containing protein n=1 Tax=Babesia caballi TaxID=5871 RepID=A0AAV4LSF7_BABCB|nr:hypothetical protein BcabD6B2_14410 [Babesia caballi]
MSKRVGNQGSQKPANPTTNVLNAWSRKREFTTANAKAAKSTSGDQSLRSTTRSRATEDTAASIESISRIQEAVDNGTKVFTPSWNDVHDLPHLLRNSMREMALQEPSRTIEKQRSHDRGYVNFTGYSGSRAVTERRGGLTWIRYPNGVLVPYIENTWLKQMLTTLLPDPDALSKFMKHLQGCLEEAVLFLYNEGIKPYLGDVANQMKRSVSDNFWSACEVAFVSLQCSDLVQLKLELRVKGEMGWVVYLLQEPPGFRGFVDTHSTVDTYSNYHWRALNKFAVEMLTAKNAPLKTGDQATEAALGFTGGRYAFAERLREEVHAFQSMRLGEVVHMVQLAIYSGIFVYAQRILLPVAACTKTAEEMFPRVKKVRHPVCLSLDEVRQIVSLLVDGRKTGLVLAQLKQQFMMQFNKELNPVVFGYRKLQNLLLSEHFSHEYQLFVPIDSPHRTHILHRKYTMPHGCRLFQQSKLEFDPSKFWSSLDEWFDEPSDDLTEAEMPIQVRSAIEDVLRSDSDDDEAFSSKLATRSADRIAADDEENTDVPPSTCISERSMTSSDVLTGQGALHLGGLDRINAVVEEFVRCIRRIASVLGQFSFFVKSSASSASRIASILGQFLYHVRWSASTACRIVSVLGKFVSFVRRNIFSVYRKLFTGPVDEFLREIPHEVLAKGIYRLGRVSGVDVHLRRDNGERLAGQPPAMGLDLLPAPALVVVTLHSPQGSKAFCHRSVRGVAYVHDVKQCFGAFDVPEELLREPALDDAGQVGDADADSCITN